MQCRWSRTADSHRGRNSRDCCRGVREPSAHFDRYRLRSGHDCARDRRDRVLPALGAPGHEHLSRWTAAQSVARDDVDHWNRLPFALDRTLFGSRAAGTRRTVSAKREGVV